MHRTFSLSAALAAAALVVLPAAAQAPAALAPPAEGPLHFAPRPTLPEITPDDLRSRLYAVADDSMMGREAGTLGNVLVTDYLAAEAARLGLRPAGEGGTFFQTVPLRARGPELSAALAVDGVPARAGNDFVPVPSYGSFLRFGTELDLRDAPAVYGGRLSDPDGMLAPEAAAGKVVVFSAPVGPGGAPAFQFWAAGTMERYAGAAALAFATLDLTPAGVLGFLGATHVGLPGPAAAGPAVPPALVVSDALAERMMGAPLEGLAVGAAGRAVSGGFRFFDRAPEHPSRNVVAVLPGSDPALRHEYVVLGSHSDHDGVASYAVDHDSLRVFNRLLRPKGADQPPPTATPEQEAAVRAELEALRGLRPARRDSTYNGADDNASGVVAMLEIAEALAARPVAPRRSVLFVWHTAEEKGLLGAEHFVGDATVPRDSIVAMLNLDMVGRGGADDTEGGGPNYLELVGSRRLSTELGDLVEAVNLAGGHGFAFDYTFDADGHPENIYCRSDHYHYARWGIPVTFFSTGGHLDYHMLTDEAQYIDFEKLARVSALVKDVAVAVADRDERPRVDRPVPDPDAPCRQ